MQSSASVRVLTIVAPLLPLVSCVERPPQSGGDAGRDAGADGMPNDGGAPGEFDGWVGPPAAFDGQETAQRLAVAICTAQSRCGELLPRETVADCALIEATRILLPVDGRVPGLRALGPLVSAGRIHFDAFALEACLVETATQDCGRFPPRTCERFLVGQVPPGGACFLDAECTPGQYCDGVFASCGVCTARLPLGTPCARDASCVSALCRNHCLDVEYAAEGEACRDRVGDAVNSVVTVCVGRDIGCVDQRCAVVRGSGPCEDGEFCALGGACIPAEGCWLPTWRSVGELCGPTDYCPGVCEGGVCRSEAAPGSSCDYYAPRCGPNLYCRDEGGAVIVGSEGTCVTRKGVGEPCVARRRECAIGLICTPEGCSPLERPIGCAP